MYLVEDPDKLAEKFIEAFRSDVALMDSAVWHQSWLHLEKSIGQGRLVHMNFNGYEGPAHLRKFFNWIDQFDYGSIPPRSELTELTDLSEHNDRQVFQKLKLETSGIDISNIAFYNAQDYTFQRAYHTPDRFQVRYLLDFGSGHGRIANLFFSNRQEALSLTSVDVTPACYLTQRLYYRVLGYDFNEYLDNPTSWQLDHSAGVINHLPAWRMGDLPSESYDMITAVQVLKEISRPVLAEALGQFHRLLKWGGALYVRDHIGFHVPNAIDLDAALIHAGFIPEWQPRFIDRLDVHGIPRIWRKPERQAIYGRMSA